MVSNGKKIYKVLYIRTILVKSMTNQKTLFLWRVSFPPLGLHQTKVRNTSHENIFDFALDFAKMVISQIINSHPSFQMMTFTFGFKSLMKGSFLRKSCWFQQWRHHLCSNALLHKVFYISFNIWEILLYNNAFQR